MAAVALDDFEDRLRGHAETDEAAGAVDRSHDFPCGEASSGGPAVERATVFVGSGLKLAAATGPPSPAVTAPVPMMPVVKTTQRTLSAV